MGDEKEEGEEGAKKANEDNEKEDNTQKFHEEHSAMDVEHEEKQPTNGGQGNEEGGERRRDQTCSDGYDNEENSEDEGIDGYEAPNPLRASGNTLEKWFRKLDVQRMNDDEDNEVQPLGTLKKK